MQEGVIKMPGISLALDDMFIQYKISTYSRLLDLVDRQLDKDFVEWEQESQAALAKIEDLDAYMFYSDSLTDEYIQRGEFKAIFLHSFFAASFASFEHELLLSCERVQKASDSPFSVKDFGNRNYTGSAKTYLAKLGVAFPANGDRWQEIGRFQKIRNSIVHQGGTLPDDRDIVDYGMRENIVTGNPPAVEVALTKEFCAKALQDILQFLLQLNQACREWRRTKEVPPVQ